MHGHSAFSRIAHRHRRAAALASVPQGDEQFPVSYDQFVPFQWRGTSVGAIIGAVDPGGDSQFPAECFHLRVKPDGAAVNAQRGAESSQQCAEFAWVRQTVSVSRESEYAHSLLYHLGAR